MSSEIGITLSIFIISFELSKNSSSTECFWIKFRLPINSYSQSAKDTPVKSSIIINPYIIVTNLLFLFPLFIGVLLSREPPPHRHFFVHSFFHSF